MGQYAQIAMQASSAVTQAVGAHRQGEAARNAARYNRRVNEMQTAEEIERLLSSQRRQRSANITRVAKSGVRLSGSPLAVIAENEFTADRERLRLQSAGSMRSGLLRQRGRSARSAGRMGVASSLLEGAGRIGALGVRNGS